MITTGKRPFDATPEKALELHEVLTLQEIANRWGISKQRVHQLVKKARQDRVLELIHKANKEG